MRQFEVDVSGGDLLSKNYTVCIANKDSIIKGFKFGEELVSVLASRYGQGFYKYKKSKKGKADLKVRLYSIVIYYLFKSLDFRGYIWLGICRDFPGRENDIKSNLIYFLEKVLGFDFEQDLYFKKLDTNSNAHKYAYLMRRDTKNKMECYIKITLEDFERWLK